LLISRVSIERPVFATVISLLLIVFGIAALLQLEVREYPDIDPPVVSVFTVYPGASAATVERDVTETIEEVLSGIEGIRTINSTSRNESSQIDIEFLLDRELDAAAADVRDKISQVRNELPDEIDEPVISKTAGESDPIIWITLESDVRSRLELTDYADRNLVDPLSIVPGVARVIIGGARRYAMRIWLDWQQMAAHEVTVTDIVERLRAQNVELPAGRIESETREFTVRTTTRLERPEEFRDMILREEGATLVRLGDVARVAIGAEDYRTGVRINGNPAVGLGVVRQSNANTLAVATGIFDEVERLRPTLPPDIEMRESYNAATFIRGSIREVVKTLAITGALVIAVIYVFLRSFRSTLVPAVTIPVSLLGTFVVLYAFGYSINVLTLLALVLAIGLVVDDSIVVVENVHRHSEEGDKPLLAAARGTDQIGFAVIATTLVLIAVFVPLTFLSGNVGRLFTEFGIALAAAVGFSSLVALTLGAMLSSKFVGRGPGATRLHAWTEAGFERLRRGYVRVLGKAVAYPWAVVVIAVALSVPVYWLYQALPRELAPTEDRGLIVIPVETPEGSSYAYTLNQVKRIEEIIAPMIEDGPALRTISIVAPSQQGPAPVNEALVLVRLKDWGERAKSQQEIAGELMPKLLSLPGVQAFAVNPPSFGQEAFSQPVKFVIGAPDYDLAQSWAEQVLAEARGVPGLVQPRLNYKETQPQIEVTVDREKAGDLGLDMRRIGRTLQLMFGEQDVTEFVFASKTYDVILRGVESERTTPDDLKQTLVRSRDGDLVALRSVINLRKVGVPPELNRVDRLPSVTLTGSLAEGAALGDVLQRLEQIARDKLPPAARISYLGLSQEYQQSAAGTYVAFALALLIVFLVLAGQFESYVHPLTIMLVVPLAIAGGLVALTAMGETFNIYSQIGLILLIGLAAKNGILIVEFANQIRDRGAEIADAVMEAGKVRFRPVLMTSIATGFGGLPLALATGPGAEGRNTIGIVVIGGIAAATLLTLFVVPVLYLLLARFTRPAGTIRRRLRKLEEEKAAAETSDRQAAE